MVRAKTYELDDAVTHAPLDVTLEERVRTWAKYSSFNHIGGPCERCGKAKYTYTPDDKDGLCINCFSQAFPAPKHKNGWRGVGRNAKNKQKGKNVDEAAQ